MPSDYASYLTKLRMVGQLGPWKAGNNEKPIIGLLTTVEIALAECTSFFHEDITKGKLISELRKQGVRVFSTIDDFVSFKDGLRLEGR